MTEIRSLAGFIGNLKWKNIPGHVKETAKGCVLDSVGMALGAYDNSQIKQVLAVYHRISGGGEKVSVWNQKKKEPLLTAVFINAMMGHTLELDDVHTDSKTHIGTVVIPAAWGMAEYLGKSGEEFLTAVICGYEAMARIGMAFGVSGHRNKGWHVTATAGTFGAAAACAKLLELKEDQIVAALGMAGTQSFGLWSFLADGASCKVLHPARAAVSGCESALLSKAGMTGTEYVLDAEDGGLLAAMSDEYDISCVSLGLGKIWQIMYMDNKPYPCCRSTHCAIDGTLALVKEHSITADEVAHVNIYTYLVGNKQCGMSLGSKKPAKPVEAKFSTPYTVACALLYRKVGLPEFLPEVITEAKVQDLLSRVSVITEDGFTKEYPNHWGCRVEILCKDGARYERHVEDASGSAKNPLTKEQLYHKVYPIIQSAAGIKAEAWSRQLLDIHKAAVMPDFSGL